MATGNMVKVKAVTDTGCTTALASTSFARSAGLHIVPVSDEEAERHKVHMGDCEYVKPVGKTIIWIASEHSSKKYRRQTCQIQSAQRLYTPTPRAWLPPDTRTLAQHFRSYD